MNKKMIIGIAVLIFLAALGGFGNENNEKASASAVKKEVAKNDNIDNSTELEEKNKKKDESKEDETEDKESKEKKSKEKESKKKSKEDESKERALKKIEIFEMLGKNAEPEFEFKAMPNVTGSGSEKHGLKFSLSH